MLGFEIFPAEAVGVEQLCHAVHDDHARHGKREVQRQGQLLLESERERALWAGQLKVLKI